MKQKTIACVILITMMLSLTGCNSDWTGQQGEAIDLCAFQVREYLNAATEQEQAAILEENSGIDLAYQSVLLEWEADNSTSYKVYLADNADYRDATVSETASAVYMPEGILIPGRTYYWKVESGVTGDVLHEDVFITADAPVRFITTASVPNVRDLGGWQTEDGGRVKYELIYRGGITNPHGENNFLEKDVILFRDTLGIRSEIDLRTVGVDDKNQTVSILGEDAPYYRTPIQGYCYIVPGFHQRTPISRFFNVKHTEAIREMFRILGDEANYPVYIHCNAGADRTGTVAYLINGVLGVSYEDLTRDFELTSFSTAGGRWRSEIGTDGNFDSTGVMQDDDGNYVAWEKMHGMITSRYKEDTLQKSIERYLLEACKVSQEDIDNLRKIMLEE